jgi:hypothetical protein
MIKKIAATILVLSLFVSSMLFVFMNQNAAISCFFTSMVLILNMTGLYIFWQIVFLKKSIALGLLIIIFKYPLIAYCIWQMSKQSWVNPIGILASMLLFLISTVGIVLFEQRRNHAL